MARDWRALCADGIELGLSQELFVAIENGYGENSTVELPAGTDNIEHISFNLTYAQSRENSEARSGRSVAVRLPQKKSVEFTSEFYMVPSDPTGSNPNLPDLHPFLYGLFGAYDNTTDPLELIYSFVPCNEISLRSYTLGTGLGELGLGLAVNEGVFSFPGDGMAKAQFNGFGQDVLHAQRGVADAPVVADNDIVLGTGEGKRFDLNSFVSVVDATTNVAIASNRQITAIVGDTLTLDGAAFSAAAGDFVVPAELIPSGTNSSEKAMVGLEGSVSIDSVALDCVVLSAEISINNNFTQRDNIYGTDKICGFLNDTRREVSISMELQMNTQTYELYKKSKSLEDVAVELKLSPNNGDAAVGRVFTFNLPKVSFDQPSIEYAAEGVVVLSFEGMALSTSASQPDQEMTLTIGPV